MGGMDGRRGWTDGWLAGWLAGWAMEKDKGQGRQGEGREWIATEQSRETSEGVSPGHFPVLFWRFPAIWGSRKSRVVLFLQAGGPGVTPPVCQQQGQGLGVSRGGLRKARGGSRRGRGRAQGGRGTDWHWLNHCRSAPSSSPSCRGPSTSLRWSRVFTTASWNSSLLRPGGASAHICPEAGLGPGALGRPRLGWLRELGDVGRGGEGPRGGRGAPALPSPQDRAPRAHTPTPEQQGLPASEEIVFAA